MTSRLPIAVAPAHHETAASYVTRLAHLHGIPFPELWQQVSRPRAASGAARFIAADRLAAVTGIPETRLARAVIEIRQPEPDWQAFRHEPQAGCPRCTARHPGGPVRQLFPHHRYVCTRHRIWIGPPDIIDQPYPALDELPEVVAAQRVHLRLLRRLGPAATYDAVLTSFLICGHRWDQDAHHPDDARLDWDERAAELIPHGTEDTTFSTSRLFAATYPEAVKIAALVGSLHWRRLAASDPLGQHRFAAEIGRRLGQPDYRPKVAKDPIAHWIDDDCWRPPSLPRTTYRTQRGFGGHTIPKANQHSIDRHRRSARWFARNRRGGRGILYHRHVGPVLARDWSRRMELFIGTVAASAEATTFPDPDTPATNGGDTTAPVIADYKRPTAVQSDYLDTAVNPAPWPTRDSPPEPRGGRPLLGHERKVFLIALGRSPRRPTAAYDRDMQRLALFDLDNTLVNRSAAFRAWAQEFVTTHCLDAAALTWLLETDARTSGTKGPFFHAVREAFRLDQTADELWQQYRQRMPELVTCRPQDLEALRLLRAAGWRIGIVTNGMTDNQHGKIHRAGLHTLVDGWCISDEVGIRKPEPAIFSIIAQRCGTSITRGGWMIGDDPILDVAGGRRAGLGTIWLQRESTLWPQDQPAPDNTIATVVDAVEILLHASQPA